MQSHVNAGGIVEDIRVRPHPADFAVLTFGHVEIIVESVADSEEIIKAALAAKDLLSPIWAIFDSIEGEVPGPKTYPEAETYIKDNDSWHTGELTIGYAVTGLGETSEPPPAPEVLCGVRDEVTRAACHRPDGHLGDHKNWAMDVTWPHANATPELDDALTRDGYTLPAGELDEDGVWREATDAPAGSDAR